MIQLFTFPAAFGLRNVSPFCLKVEMALVHLGLDFEIVEQSDPRQSPKGKLPYIVVDGESIADSELIFDELDRRTGGGLYGNLSSQELGNGFAWVRLLDDHLYWLMVASRWLDDSWWPNVKQGFFSELPFPLSKIVPVVARRQVRQTYQLHGLGKHSLEEQKEFARKDLAALDAVVTSRSYLLGDSLSVFDFSAASLLAGILDNQPSSWITEIAQDFPALKDYAERVQSQLGVWARQR